MPADDEPIAFQRFAIDRKRRVLLYDARPVALHARAFDILVFLIEHRERVLGRDEILGHVWKGLTVSDNNVTVQIRTLREVLDEHGGAGLIQTVQGKGYRFVGNVTEPAAPVAVVAEAELVEVAPVAAAPLSLVALPAEESAVAGAAPPIRLGWPGFGRRGRLAGGALVGLLGLLGLAMAVTGGRNGWFGAGPPRLSIAVLPFRNLSEGADAHQADVITDDVTTDLAHIPGSVVIARESAEMFADRRMKVAEIGAALNVRYLLEGSLRVADGVFHINAQLIEAASGGQLWAERFDTPAGRVADAQSAIVRHIATALDTELTDLESSRAVHERPDDPDAEDLFFRARSIIAHHDTLKGYTQAQRLLEQAIRLRPDFGDAQGQLGLTLVLKAQSAEDPTLDADIAEARTVIAASLEHMRDPVALAANARLLEFDGDCMQAVQSARAALYLEPNSVDALAVMAKCATGSGQLDEAAADIEAVLRLNPDPSRNKPRLLLLSEVHLLQGKFREAINESYAAIAGDDEPAVGADSMGRAEYARLLLIGATALSGDVPAARALYASYQAIWPCRSAWRVAAISPKGLATLPGFTRFISGLTAAGMPMFADEHAAAGVADSVPADGGDFAPMPLSLPGATTIDTAGLVTLLARQHPVVIDLGQGAAVIEGAVLVGGYGPGLLARIDAAIADRGRAGAREPVVVMADGSVGTAAAAAVAHLGGRGRQLFWYRGGEEAWVAAGHPATDLRGQF